MSRANLVNHGSSFNPAARATAANGVRPIHSAYMLSSNYVSPVNVVNRRIPMCPCEILSATVRSPVHPVSFVVRVNAINHAKTCNQSCVSYSLPFLTTTQCCAFCISRSYLVAILFRLARHRKPSPSVTAQAPKTLE